MDFIDITFYTFCAILIAKGLIEYYVDESHR